MQKVTIELTTDQAAAVTRMLDLATRIHLCQFGEIGHLARMGAIKHRNGRAMASHEWNSLEDACAALGDLFGFPRGASFGIGSHHVSDDAHRGYEVKKVLDKALAEWRDPNPTGIKGVNYDGLIVRYTADPAPVAVVTAR